MQRGRFSSSAEYVLYATKGRHNSDGEESPQNVYKENTLVGDKKHHIAEKPLEVMSWLLGVTRRNCLVLDPFLGGGATAIAAKIMNRRFVGIEIDRTYAELAADRVRAAKQGMKLTEYRQGQKGLF